MHATHRKGSALLIAVIVSLAIAALTAAFLVVVYRRQQAAGMTHDERRAGQAAEAGGNAYLSAINLGAAVPPAAGQTTTWVTGQAYNGGSYTVTASNNGSKLTVTSVGTFAELTHTMSFVVGAGTSSLFPGEAGALNIVGSDGPGNTGVGPNLQLQLSGGASLKGEGSSALLVQDKDTYDSSGVGDIVKNLKDDVYGTYNPASGEAPPGFMGRTTSDYTIAEGTFRAPIRQNDNLSPNTDVLGEFQTALGTYANGLPPDTTLSGTTIDRRDRTDFGSSGNPKVTVITGDVTFDNAQINGAGTLIIKGNTQILNGTRISWQGDIIILGESDASTDVVMTNAGLTVQGNIYNVNTNGQGVQFQVTDTNMTVNGTFMNLSKGSTSVQTQYTNGTINIHGLYADISDRSNQIQASNDGSGPNHFNILGAAFLASTSPTGSIQAQLSGGVELKYHENNYHTEVAKLTDFIESLGVDTGGSGGGSYRINAVYHQATP